MAKTLSMIQPASMQGPSPIAHVADDNEIIVHFASPLTADFVLCAVFYLHDGSELWLSVLDFIAYGATYQHMRAPKQP